MVPSTLCQSPLLLSEDILLPHPRAVKQRTIEVHRVARTASTQDLVRRAALRGAPDGYCCVADEQSAGRGRQGRSWIAPPGTALLASVLLRVAPQCLAGLPFAAGLAAADVLSGFGVQARIKWPNDVLIDGRKIAGILVELEPAAASATTCAAVVGLGLNVRIDGFPDDLPAASLHEFVDNSPPPENLLSPWLAALLQRVSELEDSGAGLTLEAWRQRAAALGQPVRVSTPGGVIAGVAEDVDNDGALLVRTSSGVQRVLAGDVHILPAQRIHPPHGG